jgi:hypothetical protein
METKLFDVKTNGQVIYWTTDYEIFHFIDGNRLRNDLHVKRLKRSIEHYGYIKSSLITVGDKLKVFDGQHRLLALKEIKEETGKIYQIGYVVNRELNLEKTQALNNYIMSWKPMDYIDSNIKLGNNDYSLIKKIMQEYHLTYTSVLILITGDVPGSTRTEAFRNGKIKISDVNTVIKYANWINSIKPYFKGYNTKNFVSAMVYFFEKPEFIIEEFMHKVSMFGREKLYSTTSVNSYKKLIQSLYNYHRGNKITFILE